MKQTCVTDKCDSILDKIVQMILPFGLVDFLNTRLIKTEYVDINLWSFVHIFSGFLFFLIWARVSNRLSLGLLIWFIVHTIWEIIEFLLALKGFYPALFFEEFVDIFWDTIVSMFGYVFLWIIFQIKNRRKQELRQ